MKYRSLAVFVLNFIVMCGAHLNILAQESHVSAEKSGTEEKMESLALDPIITQAIYFSNVIGDWFDKLFDKKQNMSFSTHVNDFKKIINSMQIAIIKPLATEKDRDAVALAAYNLTSLLYARAKKTYDVLDENRSNPGFIKISKALKEIDKTFMSEQERVKLRTAFQELIAQSIKKNSALCKKITELESVVTENSARTKQKGWWTLAWGLRHRLQCA